MEANFTVIGQSSDLSTAVDGEWSTCFVEDGHQNLPLSVHITDESLVDVINILLYKDFVQRGK